MENVHPSHLRPHLQSTLTSQVTTTLEEMVLSQLRPGDRLPSERELAEQFSVSRTVVREAVRALTARGLLEVRSRSGVVVSVPTQANVSQSIASFLKAGMPELDYSKVMEVRSHLEVQIAGLAAERRRQSDLQQMEAILEETLHANTLEQFVEVDLAFHHTLAKATRNELYSLLMESLDGVMRTLRVLAFYLDNGKTSASRAYRYHHAIYEQVSNRSPEGAREAMREHLIEAEDTVMRVMASRALKPAPDVAE